MKLVALKPAAALMLAHLLTLLPLYLSVSSPPWFLSVLNPLQSKYFVLAFALAGHTFALLFLVQFLLLIAGHAGIILCSLLLGLHFVLLLVVSVFFTEFGSFPSLAIATNLLYSPLLMARYALSGTSYSAQIMCFACLGIIGYLSWYSVVKINKDHRTKQSLFISAIFSAAFVLVLLNGKFNRSSYKAYGTFVHMSIPALRYWGEMLEAAAGDSFAALKTVISEAPPVSESPGHPEVPKNIFLIIMDSLRADHLPFYDYHRMTLPGIYNNHADFIAFKRHYSHSPWTHSSMSAIFSSTYLGSILEQQKAADNARLFWDSLRINDISSSFITSTDVLWGAMDKRMALDQAEHYMTPHTQRLTGNAGDIVLSEIEDEFAISGLKKLLKNSRERRFAVLYLISNHFPYKEVPEFTKFLPSLSSSPDVISTTAKQTLYTNSYDNSLLLFDNILERFFEILKLNNILEESIVIITSDHGESLGERGSYYHGFSMHEEELRVPFIVRVGKSYPSLTKIMLKNAENLHGHVDIAPTILDLFRLPAIEGHQGVSLLSENKKNFELAPYSDLARKLAVITDTQKYIYDLDSGNTYHFNLKIDPNEQHNLWKHQAVNLQDFLKALEKQGIKSEIQFRKSH